MELIDRPFVIKVVDPAKLTEHPRNKEFFDDISGEKWEEMMASVSGRGILNMPLITQDGVIVSGRQRIRAAVACGFTQIQCQVRTYNSEDEVLYDLLASNVNQRGPLVGSLVKNSRVMSEMARLYGNKNNYRNNVESPIGVNKSVGEMCDAIGISKSTYGMLATVSKIDPELADELEDVVPGRMLERYVARLTHAQQMELLHMIQEANNADGDDADIRQLVEDTQAKDRKIAAMSTDLQNTRSALADLERRLETQGGAGALDEEIKMRLELQQEVRELKAKVANTQIALSDKSKTMCQVMTENDALKDEIAELAARVNAAATEYVEVPPDDYDDVKRQNMDLVNRMISLSKIEATKTFCRTSISSMTELASGIDDANFAKKIRDIQVAVAELLRTADTYQLA